MVTELWLIPDEIRTLYLEGEVTKDSIRIILAEGSAKAIMNTIEDILRIKRQNG